MLTLLKSPKQPQLLTEASETSMCQKFNFVITNGIYLKFGW